MKMSFLCFIHFLTVLLPGVIHRHGSYITGTLIISVPVHIQAFTVFKICLIPLVYQLMVVPISQTYVNKT